MEKYCKVRKATDDNIIRPMRCACSVAKATGTNTHTHTRPHSLTPWLICLTYSFFAVMVFQAYISTLGLHAHSLSWWNLKNCQPFIQKSMIFWCIDRRCFYSHLELLYVASLLHQRFKCRNTYYYKMGFYKVFLPLHLKGNFIGYISKKLSVPFIRWY